MSSALSCGTTLGSGRALGFVSKIIAFCALAVNAGLPQWPAFTASAQNAMIFDTRPSARPLPNVVPQLKALDAYYAWRRDAH